jgi:hypothetical protein
MTGFNSYTGQLAVTVQDTNPNTQWPGDGEYMETFKRKYIFKKDFPSSLLFSCPMTDRGIKS